MNIIKFNIPSTSFTHKGKTYPIKSNKIDLVLSFIVNKMLTDSTLKNGYVDIPSIALKKMYDNYWIYIAFLIDQNIIERSPYSILNHKCMGYRFCYTFIQTLTISSVEFNNSINNSKTPVEIPEEDTAQVNVETIQRLREDFLCAEVDVHTIDKQRVENTPYVDVRKYFFNLIQLHKWNQGKYITFEWKSNRLYTNFTSLSSHYRRSNIKISGEPIIEFDISSSFPMMLALHCMKVQPDIIDDYDFKKYCTSIKNKTFYQDLTDAINLTKDCDNRKFNNPEEKIANREFNKSVVKGLFQVFLNGESSRTPYIEGYSNSFIKEQFSMKYPCINEIINQVKSNNEQIYYKLSKIETEFILGVIEDLYEKSPLIKLLTCHDAIYVPVSYCKEVEGLWNSHMDNLLNLLPDTIDNEINIELFEEIGVYEE